MGMKSKVPLLIIPALIGLIILGSGLSATIGLVPVFSTTTDPIKEAMCKNPALKLNELCLKKDSVLQSKDSVLQSPPTVVNKIEPLGCIQFKDREGDGYTKCTALKGVLTCEIGKC
jgi:hypothetical protein